MPRTAQAVIAGYAAIAQKFCEIKEKRGSCTVKDVAIATGKAWGTVRTALRAHGIMADKAESNLKAIEAGEAMAGHAAPRPAEAQPVPIVAPEPEEDVPPARTDPTLPPGARYDAYWRCEWTRHPMPAR